MEGYANLLAAFVHETHVHSVSSISALLGGVHCILYSFPNNYEVVWRWPVVDDDSRSSLKLGGHEKNSRTFSRSTRNEDLGFEPVHRI